MMPAKKATEAIAQYVQDDDGEGEYVVLLTDQDHHPSDFSRRGYHYRKTYEVAGDLDLYELPHDEVLEKRI